MAPEPMTLIELMHNHIFVTWLISWGIWPVAWCLALMTNIIFFKLPNRFFRTIKVLVRGWPPEHLDADGDHKPEPKQENLE
jgi:hypothetical protein